MLGHVNLPGRKPPTDVIELSSDDEPCSHKLASPRKPLRPREKGKGRTTDPVRFTSDSPIDISSDTDDPSPRIPGQHRSGEGTPRSQAKLDAALQVGSLEGVRLFTYAWLLVGGRTSTL